MRTYTPYLLFYPLLYIVRILYKWAVRIIFYPMRFFRWLWSFAMGLGVELIFAILAEGFVSYGLDSWYPSLYLWLPPKFPLMTICWGSVYIIKAVGVSKTYDYSLYELLLILSFGALSVLTAMSLFYFRSILAGLILMTSVCVAQLLLLIEYMTKGHRIVSLLNFLIALFVIYLWLNVLYMFFMN